VAEGHRLEDTAVLDEMEAEHARLDPLPSRVDASLAASDRAGADAVLSALGPHGSGRTTISQDSARNIIEAMQKTGARRLLTVSGSVVTDAG